MVHVMELEYRGGHRLRLRFSDGLVGVVDLRDHLSGPIFEPLRDAERFAEAYVDEELGTVVWPNDADIAPEFLYDAVAAREAWPSATDRGRSNTPARGGWGAPAASPRA